MIGIIVLNLLSPSDPDFPEVFKQLPIFSKFKTKSSVNHSQSQ